MPFQIGNSIGPRFTNENQPPPEKKKHGLRRSDVAKRVLALTVKLDNPTLEALRDVYPEVGNILTGEEVITLMQLHKAIINQDTAAYMAILASAYGPIKEDKNPDNDENLVVHLFMPSNGRVATDPVENTVVDDFTPQVDSVGNIPADDPASDSGEGGYSDFEELDVDETDPFK